MPMNTERLGQIIDKPRLVEAKHANAMVVAIEGPVCSGKSTLLKHLKASGVGVVNEYSEYVAKANRDFPKFPPTSYEQAQHGFEFFLDLEKKRIADFTNIDSSKIALDRSIYTLLAFEVGASPITKINIFDWATNRVQKEDDLILPDHIIYLDVPTDISRNRAEVNNISIPKFLLTNEFNNGFRSFFQSLAISNLNYVTMVDAQLEPEVVFKKVEDLIQRINQR